jgi:hypothetical protein
VASSCFRHSRFLLAADADAAAGPHLANVKQRVIYETTVDDRFCFTWSRELRAIIRARIDEAIRRLSRVEIKVRIENRSSGRRSSGVDQLRR